MDHCIEINNQTSSSSSIVVNQNIFDMTPWAEKLTTRIEEECKCWPPPNRSSNAMPTQNASIFKLPNKEYVEELHKVRTIAIGPYHREGNQGLLFSDIDKRDNLMATARVFHLNFRRFFCMISPKINVVRASYSEDLFELDDEALSEMLLLDSCFIICAIIALTPGPVFGSTWMRRIDHEEDSIRKIFQSFINKYNQKAQEVLADLLMVENQIPFFVVEILWEYCFEDTIFDDYSFKDVALSCFDDLYPRPSKSTVTSQFSDCLHLLDLFHWSRIPIDRFREKATYSQPGLYISTVTELQASSVLFRKRTLNCFLDIQFTKKFFKTKGVISIPEVHLYAYSSRIFQNLVAFEQAYRLRGYGFTAYAECMAQMVQTEKDVSILRNSGIIASTPMTDREVVDFFRTIRARVQGDEMPPDLYKLFEQVKDHKEHRPRYCPNKWITISVFSVSLFVLSFLQTLYSMLGYYAPTNH